MGEGIIYNQTGCTYLGYMQCQFLGDDCNWIFEYYNDWGESRI